MSVPFDIAGALAAGIAVAQGQKTWSGHDRSKTVGASEVGRCIRATWYNKQKVPYDQFYDPSLGAAERGHAIEDWLVLKLHTAMNHDDRFKDWKLIFDGLNQVTLVDEPQSATPDGLLVHTSGLVIYLEIKSQDPRIYEVSISAKTEHKTQAIQGMGLVRRKTMYKPDNAILIYVNSSFVDQYRHFIVPYTEAGDAALRKRAAFALSKTAFSLDKPPPAEGMAEGGKECEYCPFRERCFLREHATLPQDIKHVPDPVSARLHELAVMRKELMLRGEDAAASKKTVEQQIVEIMRQHNTKRVSGDWGSISVGKGMSPPVVLWDKVEQAVGDADKLPELRRPGTPYVRINVSLK